MGRFGAVRAGVVALAFVALLGCGRSKSSDAAPNEGGGGAAVGPDGRAELVIPLEPRTAGSFALGFAVEDGVQTEIGEHVLTFAVGEGYPETMLFDFTGSFLIDGTSSNATFVAVNVTVSAVSAEGDGVEARAVDGDKLEVSVREAGRYAVTIEGEVEAAEAGEYPRTAFRVPITVIGERIAGVAWQPCTAPVYVLPDTSFPPGVYLRPLREDGSTVWPMNATTERSATVSVHGVAGTEFSLGSEEEGIGSLRVSGPEQVIEVRSAFGPAGSFELVDLGRVDGLDAEFQLHGVGRSDVELVSGESYPFGISRGWIGVVPAPSVRGQPVCSVPGEELFALTTPTPDACAIAPRESCTAICDTGLLETGADVLAAGTCELVLEAPAFDAGAGRSVSLAVDFTEP